ncbi:MAG TPA: methylmalonyl Co-A mutase-associated GTPase MeaB [Atribacterota bacterium]|nr:methylmalonyl Co-A mutase-associated GTPase MeaB [Atribacterota bacterium]
MTLTEDLRKGSRFALSRILSQVEASTPAGQAILDELFTATGKAHKIGITGPPGSGKSTLVNSIAHQIRLTQPESKVAVIAVDPTSPFTGGAILGDRVRMLGLQNDPMVFIRSMASRGALGGLAAQTQALSQVFDAAGYNYILIETVGAGQSEVDIVNLAHTTIVVDLPGMGDDIQVIKAGIMEIGDIFVVNKSDRDGTDRLISEIEMMISLNGHKKRNPSIIKTVGTENLGIDRLWKEIERLVVILQENGEIYQRRRNRIKKEIYDLFLENWQELFLQFIGEDRLENEVERVLKQNSDPYFTAQELTKDFKVKFLKGGN